MYSGKGKNPSYAPAVTHFRVSDQGIPFPLRLSSLPPPPSPSSYPSSPLNPPNLYIGSVNGRTIGVLSGMLYVRLLQCIPGVVRLWWTDDCEKKMIPFVGILTLLSLFRICKLTLEIRIPPRTRAPSSLRRSSL